MRIIEYKITKQIYVKAEITRLTAFPIANNTDNFYIVIPMLTSQVPDNIMFIQETMLVPPKTTMNYIPKLMKVGVSLSQSMATLLPKGIALNILIIDNIARQLMNNNNEYDDQNLNDNDHHNDKISIERSDVIMSDGMKVNVDAAQRNLLNVIDNAIFKNEQIDHISSTTDYNNIEDNSALIINEVMIKNDHNGDTILSTIKGKRKRGRPRKSSLTDYSPVKEAQQEFQTILTEDN